MLAESSSIKACVRVKRRTLVRKLLTSRILALTLALSPAFRSAIEVNFDRSWWVRGK
ncbi:MAG: hypothetical protein WDN47_05115 [Candidatus Doudnabacteria bacterium]